MKLSKEFKVGLFMVVALALLYFGFNFLKGIDFFSTTNKYYAIYQNVDKLTESNQIFLNGYAVGRVSNIEIQQSRDRVIVELDIDSDIVLTDSSIAMLNGEILGGRFIQLDVRGGGKKLDPKDTMRSEVAKGIMDFITQNAQPVASSLTTTLKKVNELLENLSGNSKRLDTLFAGLQSTPRLLNTTLTTANTNINDLGANFKTVATNLNGTLEELKPTIANLHVVSDSLKMMQLNGTVKKAQESLTKLNETLAKLNKGDNTASKLLTEDTLYVNLNKMLQSIDSLAQHFNNNPRHFLSPLGKSSKKIEKELSRQRKSN
ncbi:MlaD family protein [Ohtaekwangia kribbensis]|jgi:phospholipid/cholesterol/gamma-HCH transport system substrate-binding protein|uniref:MlaD family protein n=1 Tax=Ohtaekwangia kribbensis TaxID=688913 RepID=A0ABW3KCK9_9BACT